MVGCLPDYICSEINPSDLVRCLVDHEVSWLSGVQRLKSINAIPHED